MPIPSSLTSTAHTIFGIRHELEGWQARGGPPVGITSSCGIYGENTRADRAQLSASYEQAVKELRMRPDQHSPMAGSVEKGIRSVAELERAFEEKKSWADRLTDRIAGFTGSIWFVVVHVAWFVAWFAINTKLVPAIHEFDPYPFILLSMMVSVEAVLLSTFVLMKQNRMQRRTDQRDHLTLQIDLLSEREVTKVLQLLRLVCQKLEIREVETDKDLAEMANITSVNIISERISDEMPSAE
jgi:uncharacterized membrane protein